MKYLAKKISNNYKFVDLIFLTFFLKKITYFEQKYLFHVFTLYFKKNELFLQENKKDIFVETRSKLIKGQISIIGFLKGKKVF